MRFALDENAIRAVFSLPAADGSFDPDFANYLAGIAKRPVLFFAFAPKAAGTFLRSAAIEAVDGQLVRVTHAQGGRDAQPYLPVFVYYHLGGVCECPMVVHAHMQAFPANRRFCEALNLKPIVMLRPIPDMLASLWDMFERDGDARRDGLNCHVPKNFLALSRTERAEYLVDMIAPWYVSYYAGWSDYAAQAPARVLCLRYDDFVAKPAEILMACLEHGGLPRDLDICRRAIDSIWAERGAYRFNQGVAGRGAAYFSDAQRAQLERLLRHYPELNDWRGDLL